MGSEISAFRDRLRARGKPGKVIMVAVMRKLLVRLNAVLRDALNRHLSQYRPPCGSLSLRSRRPISGIARRRSRAAVAAGPRQRFP